MASRSYALFTPVLSAGSGSGTLTVTDSNDEFFEVPDVTAGGQSALVNGLPVTINSVAAALGPQVVVAIVDGASVDITVTPVRIIVESGTIDTTYIIYPELPPDAEVISVSVPLAFPDPVGLPVCLTVDTTVMTDHGWRKAGSLRVGDLVMTLDDGLQPVRWLGCQPMAFHERPLLQRFRPVVIEPGALGPGMPERRLTVSPLHAILVRSPHAMLLFGESEVFVAARHLVNGSSIRVDKNCKEVIYCHILLDKHAILLAEGALVESLFLGDVAMRSVNSEARAEILAIFPQLRDHAGPRVARARLLLKEFEARVLTDRLWPQARTA